MTGDPKVSGFAEDELEGKSGGGGGKEPGALCYVAPTILDIMVRFLFPSCLLRLMSWIQGIPKPEGMLLLGLKRELILLFRNDRSLTC